MQIVQRSTDISRVWPYSLLLLIVAFGAFWPTYLSLGFAASGGYVHFHAAMATSWMVLLIIQPLLISRYNYDLHRKVGTSGYIIAPMLVVSILLLANYRLRAVSDEAYPVQTYVLYLQFSLAFAFVVCYTLAMAFRRQAEVHARFMVCTGLTLIDPVFARIIAATSPTLDVYEQWVTFGLTDLLLIVLIILTRKYRIGRWVFPFILLLLVLVQMPALLKLTELHGWQSFAEWYRSLAIT